MMKRISYKVTKTEVTYSCGHTITEMLGSTEEDKRKWIALAITIPCRKCVLGK